MKKLSFFHTPFFHFIGNSEGIVSMIFIRTPYVESVKFKYNKRFSLI